MILGKPLLMASGAMALLVLCVVIFTHFNGGEEGAIKNRFDDLVDSVEKAGREPRLMNLGKAKKVSEYFTEDCRFQVMPWQEEVSGRDTVLGLTVQMRSNAERISVSQVSRSITVASGEGSANMTVGIKGKAVFADATENFSQKFFIDWTKEDGVWMIERISVPQQ